MILRIITLGFAKQFLSRIATGRSRSIGDQASPAHTTISDFLICAPRMR